MKNITITMLVFTICLTFTGKAQLQFDYPITEIEPAEYIVTYSHTYQRDSLSDFTNQSDMFLFLGKNTSYFISSKFYSQDTIVRKISNMEGLQSFLMDRNRPFPKISYRIWKNYPPGKITHVEGVPSNVYRYEETLNLFDWYITDSTDTIQGYFAQKATCNFGGRQWVAWFTKEIPYNDGPYKFNGLPGLILTVYDTQKHYVFDFIKIEKPDYKLMIDIKEKNYVETTKQNFFRAKDAFYGNIISRAKEAGLDKKAQQHVAKSASRRNNPIELKRD